MNTGIQKSGLTPFGARTTTTPAGKNDHGCLTQKKNLFEIVCAHGLPYAATASVGYLNDFTAKVEKASKIRTSSPPVPPAGATPPTRRSRLPRRSLTAACGIWPSTRVLR